MHWIRLGVRVVDGVVEAGRGQRRALVAKDDSRVVDGVVDGVVDATNLLAEEISRFGRCLGIHVVDGVVEAGSG